MPNKRKPTADEIAEMASRGEDVSRFFTNRFTAVAPDGPASSPERNRRAVPAKRDIHGILERLHSDIAELETRQLQVAHPGADDDGIWFINLRGQEKTVQIEGADGNCPFLIETDFSAERITAGTIDEVIAAVERLLSP